MKKCLLLSLSLAVCVGAIAQVAENFPNGFRRAEVPASLKSYSVKVPYRSRQIDNQAPLNVQRLPRTSAPSPITINSCTAEDVIATTWYDLQTNNAISNRLVVNVVGGVTKISAAYTFSPDNNQGPPIYPNRGTGYNYYDGTSWLYPYPGIATRTEGNVRTGFTNILVCNDGAGPEMTIAHTAVGTDYNQLALNWRATAGSGGWTISYPWGASGNTDTWPKATAEGNNCYVIWQGSGAAASTTTPPNYVAGQNGPIFFSKSTDGGVTWTPRMVIPAIDTFSYAGFGGDSYSIDAAPNSTGGYVAISFSDPFTDVGLLKSSDGGNSWTKTIIRHHPIDHYVIDMLTDTNADGDIDTLFTNSGDGKVLIDNQGMCHLWFSDFKWYDDNATDASYNYFPGGSDNLFYWNENMGAQNFVAVAAVQDLNGDGVLGTPEDATCSQQWGNYGGGLTQMPTAGIDANGKIYCSYQTIDETADTGFYHQAHRHVYMFTLSPPYDPTQWTYPYDIVPDTTSACLGDGYNQEAVFACTGRLVTPTTAYVLYQRDNAPGHALAAAGTCDAANNVNPSDIVVAKVDVLSVGIKNDNSKDVFVSQNYPNPSIGSTYINVALKNSSDLKFEVYDIIGKTIYTETKSKQQSGTQTIRVNTSQWNPGIYNYTVTANGQKVTRQMIVQ